MRFTDLPFPSVIRMPWSGDIVQDIRPEFFSPSYSGDAEVEAEVIKGVAGYGRQLGWVSEALMVLIDRADDFEGDDADKIAALRKMVKDIDGVKRRKKKTVEGKALSALETLRIVDKDAYWKLIDRAAKENAAR